MKKMMSPRFFRAGHALCLSGLATLMLSGACSRQNRRSPPARAVAAASADFTGAFIPDAIGLPVKGNPWIAHLRACDLDGDGLLDVLACEAQENQVLWLRQTERGHFAEQVLPATVKAPVHVEVADLDGDGDLDVLVAAMGVVFPNNDRIGTVVVLENRGERGFVERVILENTSRVTDVKAADLDGDGRVDLVLGQFGYDQGEVRWLRQTAPWTFEPRTLLELSGAMNVCVADFNGDGLPDVAAQMSQQWEEIYLFTNRGRGEFTRSRIWGSANEDYGSSGMTVADLNRDGRPDLVFANGDGFGPAVVPGPRSYHGLQWLENRGDGYFAYHRIGDMSGAYSPEVVDLDGDGELDVVAVAAFIEKDSRQQPVPSVVWFRNNGDLSFEKRPLAFRPQHQVTVTVGDFDGTGRPSLVTGGFYVFAPAPHMGRITRWRAVK